MEDPIKFKHELKKFLIKQVLYNLDEFLYVN